MKMTSREQAWISAVAVSVGAAALLDLDACSSEVLVSATHASAGGASSNAVSSVSTSASSAGGAGGSSSSTATASVSSSASSAGGAGGGASSSNVLLNDLRLARQIRPFIALFQSGLTMVTDTSSQAQSEYWQAFLSLYGALVKSAEHDPMLTAEVQDLIDFMAQHVKKQKAPDASHAAVVAPVVSPTGGEPPPK